MARVRFPVARFTEDCSGLVFAGERLVTFHKDRPGVLGGLCTLLGQRGINISRMQLGTADGDAPAMAISRERSCGARRQLRIRTSSTASMATGATTRTGESSLRTTIFPATTATGRR
jgi:hypothetical protein